MSADSVKVGMTADEREWLTYLARGGVRSLSTEAVRQRCRKRSWSRFIRSARHWLITDAGFAALIADDEGPSP